MNILTTLRNNWKKSIFFTCAFGYGGHYLYERNETHRLYQSYCVEAFKYGQAKAAPMEKLTRVTVFINPMGNQQRSKSSYDQWVAPMLHLSGLDVRLIRLDNKKEAAEFMQVLDENTTDCIVIAGGNATISEVLTGLLKRADAQPLLSKLKIGVIPLGENNSLAKKIFNPSIIGDEVRLLANATMAVIKGETKPIDALKIEMSLIDRKEEAKSLYALSSVSFGFESDKVKHKDSYWYFWPFKKRMNEYMGDRMAMHAPNEFAMAYVNYCNTCRKCFDEKNRSLIEKVRRDASKSQSVLHRIFKRFIFDNRHEKNLEATRLSMPVNEDCERIHEMRLKRAQVNADVNEQPGVKVDVTQLDEHRKVAKSAFVFKKFELRPLNRNAEALLIDNELFELSNCESVGVELVADAFQLLRDPIHNVTIKIGPAIIKPKPLDLDEYLQTVPELFPFRKLFS